MNCTPFVRQYDMLSDEWGVYYAKRSTKPTVYAGIFKQQVVETMRPIRFFIPTKNGNTNTNSTGGCFVRKAYGRA